MIGVYVHVPFCYKKCNYCDFNSYQSKEHLYDAYFNALKKEIGLYKCNKEIKSVYIGGGTPSIVPAAFIEEIFENLNSQFNISKKTEITIEANPGTLSEEKLKRYKAAGINRLSMGLQTINENMLEKLGRCHNVDAFLESFNQAKRIGFDNISADVMFGIPGQTFKDWKETLDMLLDLNLNHVSCYGLKIEKGTVFSSLLEKKEIELMDDELERQMYYYAIQVLNEKGIKHYEISNFAKKGFESMHNLNYWECGEYIGLGAGAHSYYENYRYSNISNLENYIWILENEKDLSKRIEHIENIDDTEKKIEFMILGLRKLTGVSDDEFKRRFRESFFDIFCEKIKQLEIDGYVKIDGARLCLTKSGIDFANKVMVEFL